MATNRNTVLANGYIYHVYNRGVERRQIFMNTWGYERFIEIMRYYQYKNPPIRYSKYLQQSQEVRKNIFSELTLRNKIIEILAYCLMPNHFHFLIRQNSDKGITQFLANISNSYSKYFNTKYTRVGPLLQGTFKAVLIETDEQLLHISRYIHLNPVASLLVPNEKLDDYPWSSFPEYLGKTSFSLTTKELILSHFPSLGKYREFVHDNISYAQTLERLKHLYFEE